MLSPCLLGEGGGKMLVQTEFRHRHGHINDAVDAQGKAKTF